MAYEARGEVLHRRLLTALLGAVALLAIAPGRSSAQTAPQETAPPPSTAPAPVAPAPAAAAPAKEVDDGYRTSGIIPGVLLGPKATATLLFPPSVMVGAEVRVIGYIGASFEYGVFPRNQTIQGYTTQISSWSAGLRAYPWRGAFFVGAVLGRYDVSFSQTAGAGSQFQTASLDIAATYLGPQIGWKWTWDFGLFLGLNLGYGFSLDYKSTMTNPALASSDLVNIQKNADQYVKTGIPIVTLLELGFLF